MSSPDTKLQSLFPGNEIHSPPTPRYSLLLISYFRSGWAFLIPYLAAYLLYAWLKWPVNPANGGVEEASLSLREGANSWVPCLLHIYWALHAVHLALGALALRTWWKDITLTLQLPTSTGASSALPSTADRLLSTGYRLLPWLGLGLIFWIPGIYLEWPSDPWEHLRRINEWHILDEVTAHSNWKKSSYFLPYSLTQHVTGLTQLSWLNLYYTAMCLLLSWQYYRLARAAGLGERAAMIFVILQALLMGNNVFSFYRYYGLSSSILAQLGAIALTRLALKFASRGTKSHPYLGHESTQGAANHSPGTSATPDQPALSLSEGYSLLTTRYSLLRIAGAVVLLLPLIVFNHIQGIGIAGLGILAVIVWRLVEWKRSMLGWIALTAVFASIATVLWFPRHPALDEIYRPQGWLTAWYGFNLFSPASPALERTYQILGTFGVLNLFLGLWLILRRNHVAGWLTLMPVIALILPCFALPFAHVLAAEKSVNNIITFHRMLFAMPMGLALVAIFGSREQGAGSKEQGAETGGGGLWPRLFAMLRVTPRGNPFRISDWSSAIKRSVASVVGGQWSIVYCLLLLLLLTTLPSGFSSFNRLWHSLQITPDDLQLKPYVAAWTPDTLALAQKGSTLVATTPLGSKVQEIFVPSLDWRRRRQIHAPLAAAEIEQRLDWLSTLPPSDWVQTGSDSSPFSNWRSFSRRVPTAQETQAIADFTARDTPWLRLGGRPPKHEFTDGRLTISNPAGASSQAFNPDLIPIARDKRYQLTSTIRQIGDPTATNYLAVVWYDQNGKVLQSHQRQPEGAGRPIGWSNGTYSYYGLANRPAPPEWTSYAIAFGFGEVAAIPANAAFLRAGALLNHRGTPETITQLTEMVLSEKPPYAELLWLLPGSQRLITPASQAAWLSRHWPLQQTMMEHGGAEELHTRLLDARLPAASR